MADELMYIKTLETRLKKTVECPSLPDSNVIFLLHYFKIFSLPSSLSRLKHLKIRAKTPKIGGGNVRNIKIAVRPPWMFYS